MSDPADDEAYDAGDATRVRRPDGEVGRAAPRRPGAPSAPPPPAESFRPAAPPPPAEWFTPAGRPQGGSGGGEGAPSARPRRDQDPDETSVETPGSAGYTSQPGIPAERYPTPRPGQFSAPVAPTRRPVPRSRADKDWSAEERSTQRIDRVDDAARPGGRPSGPQDATENLAFGERGRPGSADAVPPTRRADYDYGAASTSGGGRQGTGGYPASAYAEGGYTDRGYRDSEDKWGHDQPASAGPPSDSLPLGGAGRKRRRRRWPKITAIVVVVLLVVLVGVDRLAAHIAVSQMRKQVAVGVDANLQPGQTPPTIRSVSIGGFPFLTQVLFGKYTDIGVGLDNIPTTTDGPRISSVDAHLKGVHVALSDAIGNKIKNVPVDQVTATVQMTYADLNAYLKTQKFAFQLAPADGGKEVKVTGTATLDDLGLSSGGTFGSVLGGLLDSGKLQFGGTATFSVENNVLKLTPINLTINGSAGGLGGGGTIPLGKAGIPITIPIPNDLPFSVKIDSASSTATGLSVTASAKNVSLPAKPPTKK